MDFNVLKRGKKLSLARIYWNAGLSLKNMFLVAVMLAAFAANAEERMDTARADYDRMAASKSEFVEFQRYGNILKFESLHYGPPYRAEIVSVEICTDIRSGKKVGAVLIAGLGGSGILDYDEIKECAKFLTFLRDSVICEKPDPNVYTQYAYLSEDGVKFQVSSKLNFARTKYKDWELFVDPDYRYSWIRGIWLKKEDVAKLLDMLNWAYDALTDILKNGKSPAEVAGSKPEEASDSGDDGDDDPFSKGGY